MLRLINGLVYKVQAYDSGSTVEFFYNYPEYTETKRVDDETVADIAYVFDIEQNQYVEQSRVEREEVLPPEQLSPEQERIEQLEEQNLTLAEAIADLYEMMLGAK